MPHEVPAAVAVEKGAPVEVHTIVVPDPGPGEVLVTVPACGVCHTDLRYREGAITDVFPFPLGHEAEASRPVLRFQDRGLCFREHTDRIGIGSHAHKPMPIAPFVILVYDGFKARNMEMPSSSPFTEEDRAPTR